MIKIDKGDILLKGGEYEILAEISILAMSLKDCGIERERAINAMNLGYAPPDEVASTWKSVEKTAPMYVKVKL